MWGFKVQAFLWETNRKCFHLKWLLNLQSVRVYKTNSLSEMSFSWSRSCTEEWVNTIYHPSHCIKGSGKQCRLNCPPSGVYPRGAKFTYKTAEHSGICFARRCTVKVCAQAWTPTTLTDSHPCMHAQRDKASRHVDTEMDMHMHNISGHWRMQTHTQMQTSKHTQVQHTVFLSLSGRVDLQRLAGGRLHS